MRVSWNFLHANLMALWLGGKMVCDACALREGRVGRVLVRKLLLRGYKVTALARPHEGQEVAKPLPPAVEVVPGDVGDFAACYRAVQGVDKARCAGGPGPRPSAACRRGGPGGSAPQRWRGRLLRPARACACP